MVRRWGISKTWGCIVYAPRNHLYLTYSLVYWDNETHRLIHFSLELYIPSFFQTRNTCSTNSSPEIELSLPDLLSRSEAAAIFTTKILIRRRALWLWVPLWYSRKVLNLLLVNCRGRAECPWRSVHLVLS